MVLNSQELILRPFVESDADDLYEYLCRPEVVRYEPYGVQTRRQCHEWAAQRARQDCFWAVCQKDGGKLIGNLYFQRQEPFEWNTWELGYVFNSAYWGRGYATQAARCLLRHAFEQLDAHRVVAQCNPENTASWRLLERLGMRREGHFLQNASFDSDAQGNPIWLDTFLYAILDTEWGEPTRHQAP
ncbi:MAG: GNAT family N-acetyltransferase [Eubacteriales bacterium]|nr:GNAT family N-acetyltransferase [Eubacteriales bacterium]